MTVGLSTTAIVGDLCGYFIGNVPCKNPFSTNKAVAHLPLRSLGFLVVVIHSQLHMPSKFCRCRLYSRPCIASPTV